MSSASIVHDVMAWLLTVTSVTSLLGTGPQEQKGVFLYDVENDVFPAIVLDLGGAYWEEAFGQASTGIRVEDIDFHCMALDKDISIQIFEALVKAIEAFPQESMMPPTTGRVIQTIRLVTASGRQDQMTETKIEIGKRSLQAAFRYEEI